MACKMQDLQELCLKTIVCKFERFYEAFSTSEDMILQRNFEFLQRKYSFEILSRLISNNDMAEKYMDLLVNRYLKTIHTCWFRCCSWEKVAAKISEIGNNIEKIFFQDLRSGEDSERTPWEDVMKYLPNLKCLSFNYNCHDEILTSIAKYCPNLVEINLEYSEITDDSIKLLVSKENGKTSCPKLKKLNISSTKVEDDGVEYLIKSLPSLEIIDYPHLPRVLHSMHKDAVSSLDNVEPYNITSLDLMNYVLVPFFNELLEICLSLCPYLKSLTCPLHDKDHVRLFSKLAHLEKLQLECFSNTGVDINNILKAVGSKVTSLTLVNCILSVSVLAESCPRIKELCLNKVTFLCEGESKPIFHCLESCTFEFATDDHGTPKAISLLLSSSSKLECISFRRCVISSSEIKEYILKCCESFPIQRIFFSWCVVEVEFIKDIMLNCRSLRFINLEGCDFESDEEDELYKFTEILPNYPIVSFSAQLSFSDYDDFLNDFYDFEYDSDDENYDDDYDDDEFYLNDFDDYEDDNDEDFGFVLDL